MAKKQNSILSAAFIITVANISSSLLGLLRERVLIKLFFNNIEGQQAYEAFQVAFQIPDLLFQLIVLGALSAAFIPLFTELKRKDKKKAFTFTSTVMNLVLLIFAFFSIVAFIFARPITLARTGAEFTPEQVEIAVNLTRVMLFAQFFFAISNFLTGILQAYQRFIIPAIAPLVYNLGIIITSIFLAQYLGIYAAGLGVVIGAALHMLIQLPLILKTGYRWQASFDWRFSEVKKLFKMMPPRLMTVGVGELQNLAMGFFATSIGNLSFVIINLARRLMTLPIRFFGVPISQASFPFLSEESADANRKKFNQLLLQSLNQISFLAMPASVLLLILRVPAVRLVFGTANFPWQTTIATGKVVALIAISITAQAMVQLLIRGFYALKDTRTPFMVTTISVLVYLMTNVVGIYVFNLGVFSLGISITVAAFVELLLMLILLQKKIQCFTFADFFLPQLKILLASFFMAVFLYLPFKILDEVVFDTTRTVDLIALTVSTSTIALLVYLYFSILFDVKELSYFNSLIAKFGKWRPVLEDSQEVLLDSSIEDELSK
ncbi:murein biosynthesis integral membrane protein MurJ [Candidatus Woesebacteria bacterium]|nr:murein biosynthesis integral membrane protein MurJ [Candidatus Woesebacteria bacterium]HNV45257.1 murein biosynthesis integral membrane protein MurJ [Candidatus Woesebacteria bacterium]HOA11889.1 murein biosynthesis integral membrane protein MurJ [Candidatus Woesebacteria bacterium]HOI04924.1 murein biosynthesis integral membrane protein MurJ [Candidatus Woesebacteria bacterium]HQL11186.1 murein biosynthesis integral membrane protein MurJ [Candidatus Woesebacteria bacterium]